MKFPAFYKLLITVLLVTLWRTDPCDAQNASIQDCLGAIPVCQKVYVEDQAPIGFGTMWDFNPGNTCMGEESNSIWYTFTVNQSGAFGFLLTPQDPNIDYDWVLFNITNASCEDLFFDPSLVVSCNAAGADGCFGPTGATGDTQYNNQGANCGNFPPSQNAGFTPFNDLIDVVEGNTYVLCINNFLGAQSGYTIDFGLSTNIGIFDETPPSIENLGFSGNCNGASLELDFSEFIQCATIDASLFQLNGPGGPYNLSLSGVNCQDGGNYEKKFTVQVSPPVTASGNYTFSMATNGTTEVLDLCGLPAAPQTLDFSFDDLALSFDLGNDATLCQGETIALSPGVPNATYLWQDGATNPSYVVSGPGAYSVTVSNACSTASDTIVINYHAVPSEIDLGPDTTLCEGATLALDATVSGSSYLWQDGSFQPTFTVTSPGQYSVQVSSDCAVLSDTILIEFAQGPAQINLGNDTLLCTGNTLLLDATSANASYVWQDGSTSATYTVSSSGQYSVSVSLGCGAVEDEIAVDFLPPLTIDLGVDTMLCPGEAILLNAESNATSYLWQDGTNASSFIARAPGTYSVTVSDQCETVADSVQISACTICKIYIPNVFSPNSDSGNNYFSAISNCELTAFNLKIFDRWGDLVYEGTTTAPGWDGKYHNKLANNGLYVYIAQFKVEENGKTVERRQFGDVMLLR